jgi:hypothetical protein
VLKDNTYAISKEFLQFFHIDATEMTFDELYDAFISCLLIEI